MRDVVKELYSNEMSRKFCKLSDEIPSNNITIYIYYVPHRHYEHAVGIKLLVHNLATFANISVGLPKNRELTSVTFIYDFKLLDNFYSFNKNSLPATELNSISIQLGFILAGIIS